MNITIHNFEQHISIIILERGLAYFTENLVENLALENGKWVADVYGTDDYEVEVRTEENGNIQGWLCDCPYDRGPICKHVVATLLAIREEWNEQQTTAQSSPTPSTTDNVNPVTQIIKQLDETETRKLLTYFAQRHNEVRAYLLTNYANALETTSKAQYVQLVQSIIDAHVDQRGFLGYQEADRLGDKIVEVLNNADGKSTLQLIYLCEAVIEQLTQVVDNADDSSGSLAGALSSAFDMLGYLAEPASETPHPLVRHIFEYASNESQDAKYEGWDWKESFHTIAAKAIRKQLQAEQLIAVLDRYVQEKTAKEYGHYDAEQGQRLKYKLLQEYFSASKAADFLQQNLSYTSFRNMALEQAFAAKEYDRVRQLAEDGIALDTERKHPGTVNQWKKWLLRLAEATGDTAALVQANEDLFLNRGDMQYYRATKKLLSPANFAKKVEQYIAHFRDRNRRWKDSFNQSVANILQEEGRWEDLLAEVKKDSSLRTVDHYYPILGDKFSDDFLDIYVENVQLKMANGMGRELYQECCDYIDKIVHLGGQKEAKKIVAGWRKAYPRNIAQTYG